MPLISPAQYFENVRDTVQTFWHGMSVTLSYMLRKPITTQYPDRTPLPVRDTLPARYRGFLEVDSSICTGCQACERACPIGCIQITLEKDPANPKQRMVSQFDIDEAKCMFCGLCVEPCPTGSIQHTREFEGSTRAVQNLVFRWADPLNPFPVYKVDKSAEYYPRAPVGSLVRAKLERDAWDRPAPKFLPPEPPKPAAAKPAAPKPAAAPAAAAAPATPKAGPSVVANPAAKAESASAAIDTAVSAVAQSAAAAPAKPAAPAAAAAPKAVPAEQGTARAPAKEESR